MLLVYYRLYITYTLAGFLFDLDQSNIYRDIKKIERSDKKCVPIPQKIYNITKRLQTPEEVEKYFPGFMAFTDLQNNRYQDLLIIKEEECTIQARRKDILVKNQITVNNRGYILHKVGYKKEENMTMIYIRITILSTQKKLLM